MKISVAVIWTTKESRVWNETVYENICETVFKTVRLSQSVDESVDSGFRSDAVPTFFRIFKPAMYWCRLARKKLTYTYIPKILRVYVHAIDGIATPHNA